MSKVGLIARCDLSGLGYQTRRLARLIKPDKIMLIDSTPFNGAQQFPNWYKDYDSMTINGFPNDLEVRKFLTELDVVISCETFYNNRFTQITRNMETKTILIANFEFLDYLKPNWSFVPPPDKMITPSYWHLIEMKQLFNAEYLPTPIFDDEFKSVREHNLERTGRNYLFMQGTTATSDRNGLESLYEALPLAKGDFTITIKAQQDAKKHPDPRLIYDFTNPENQQELYKGFDALIFPRRYGGQALSMCEALTCGLPVVMTDIEPNNKVLPREWLVPAEKIDSLMTRTLIDVYSADPIYLAERLDYGINSSDKEGAVKISKQFAAENLRSKYEELLK